jgi:hypothetical protein
MRAYVSQQTKHGPRGCVVPGWRGIGSAASEFGSGSPGPALFRDPRPCATISQISQDPRHARFETWNPQSKGAIAPIRLVLVLREVIPAEKWSSPGFFFAGGSGK